jgi:hypothetical protein
MRMSSISTLVTSGKRHLEVQTVMAMEFRITISPLIINRVALATHMDKVHTCWYMKR